MARVNNLTDFLTDVASAIKTKKGSSTVIPAANFDTEILALPSQGVYQTKETNITTNGNYEITPDTNYDAMDKLRLNVNVPTPQLQTKSYTFTQNTTTTLTPETNYDGFSSVDISINVPSSGSGDVKLFETEQAMQADPNPSEGDLAVVYREELTAVTAESEFDSCTFPNEVVLDEAFTDSIHGSFRAVDQSVMFDGMVDVSSNRFRFNAYTESGSMRIQYTSSDGITYTRTDAGEELQEFGVVIKWEDYGEEFNSVIGNFMKIGGNYFEGLYQYNKTNNLIEYQIQGISDIKYSNSSIIYTEPSVNGEIIISNQILSVLPTIIADYYNKTSTSGDTSTANILFIQNETNIIDIYIVSDSTSVLYSNSNNGFRIVVGTALNSVSYSGSGWLYRYNLTTNTYSAIEIPYANVYTKHINSNGTYFTSFLSDVIYSNINKATSLLYQGSTNSLSTNYDLYIRTFTSGDDWVDVYNTNDFLVTPVYLMNYQMTQTQLDTTADYVYEKTFYGKNGVETGILGTPDNSFADTSAAVYTKVRKLYDVMTPRVLTDSDKDINKNIYVVPSNANGVSLLDTSGVTNMNSLFQDCKNLIEVSLFDTSNVTSMHSIFLGCSSLTTIPLLNTSNVTDMTQMFYNCSSLATIPLLDTSNVTRMYYMFLGCLSLTTIPQLNTSNVTDMFGMFSGCTSLTSIPQLDTSNVTQMMAMFYGCSSLITIPQLNTSKVTSINNLTNVFDGCTSLSNESLNNILYMCAHSAITTTSKKTLKTIGLTETQATTCQGLSNYSAFTAAGWTTGY